MNDNKTPYEHYLGRYLGLSGILCGNKLKRQSLVYRRYFLRFLPRDKKAKILDIGCGFGGFLYFLNEEGYTNAFGVDRSQEQIDMAQKLGQKNTSCADIIDTFKRYTREFDVITALDVVEHFKKEDLFVLFGALSAALKPGGIFIMQSPNADGLFSGRYRYGDITHEISFTPNSIVQLLSLFDFEEIRVYPVAPLIHGVMSFARYIIWQLFRGIIIIYLAAETGLFRGHLLTQNLIVVAKRKMS